LEEGRVDEADTRAKLIDPRAAPPRGPARRPHPLLGKIVAVGVARPRFLRDVTLKDGETVHNVFFDRNFREGEP
jgi:hypothetical protein